jgi:hypothetical protein
MKKLNLELFYIIALIPAIFPKQLIGFGLSLGLPWTMHYVLLWILVSVFAILTAIQCWKTLQGHPRFWATFLAFTIPLGAYFAANPIYQGDFNKYGKTQDILENDILSDVLIHNPDFSGLVCVASANCPFCIEAVREKINVMHKRNKVSTLVYISYGDSSIVEYFRELSGAPDIEIIVNSNPEGALDIDESVIPIFIFIQNGRIVHLWRNDQLGYPALDWIESGLK